jgi:kynurenine formamidase
MTLEIRGGGFRRLGGARALAARGQLLALLLALPLAAGCAVPAASPSFFSAGDRIVDLTHPFDAEAVYWPTEEGFVHERGSAGWTDAGYYYEAHRFRAAEHGGTHIDAPIHFGEGRRSVDRIPVAELMGPGALVDVSEACAGDRDYRVRVADLEAWEARFGRLPEGAMLLLRTGFGRFWPDRARYLGTHARGPKAVADLHFPGLHPDAARWLAEQRSIRAVGLDTPSIDHGQSTRFQSHVILFAHEIPALENLANLEELPESGFRVIALPMKIRDASGAPLRIIALVPPR